MTTPLQLAINAAVGEFSDRIQSLAMPRAVTLAEIIRMHVEPLLAKAQEDLALSGARLADETKRAQDNFAQALEHRSAHERILSTLRVAEEMRQRLIAERNGWKARAEAFLDFDRLKGVLMGEFSVEHFDGCDSYTGDPRYTKTAIPWTTIKEILKRAALAGECDDAPRNATALEPAASRSKEYHCKECGVEFGLTHEDGCSQAKMSAGRCVECEANAGMPHREGCKLAGVVL